MVAGPNPSISKPKRSSSRGAIDQRLMRGRGDVDHQGDEQPLRLERSTGKPLHHPLEQHPLVRNVLIDDRHPFIVHRNDERVAKLAERNHRPDLGGRVRLKPGATSGRRRRLVPPVQRRVRRQPGRIRAASDSGYAPLLSMPGIDSDHRRWHGDLRPQLQLRRAAMSERVHQRSPHHLVNQRLIAEPHLRFRRVHVDVDRVGRHLEEQMHLRAALLDRRDAVGVDDRRARSSGP